MSDFFREFSPHAGEDTIYLKQVEQGQHSQVDPTQLLSVDVPPDEIDVLIGMIDGVVVPYMSWWGTAILCVSFGLVALFCTLIVIKVFRGSIDLSLLISEANGKASMSRVQALIFTIVLAGSLMVAVANTGQLPSDIPTQVLWIMSGSLGTYLLSKGIQTYGGTPVAIGAGQQGLQSGTGPLVRFGAEQTVDIGSAAQNASQSVFETSVTVSTSAAQNKAVVAVAVGKTQLEVNGVFASQDIDTATVHYVDATGMAATADLATNPTITTLANSVTVVEVSFQPNSFRSVDVPVRVRAL